MKAVLAVIVLLSVIVAACGLQCYVCNSHRDPACGDPFFPTSISIKRAYLLTCNESPDGLKPFCRKSKTYVARNGEIRIHRDCGYLEREGYECYQKRSDDYITDVCQCKDELCNSASSYGIAALTLVIPFTVAAIL